MEFEKNKSEYGSTITEVKATSDNQRPLSERASNGVLFLGWIILLFGGFSHCARYLIIKYGALHFSLSYLPMYYYSAMLPLVIHLQLCLMICPRKSLTVKKFSQVLKHWQTYAMWIIYGAMDQLVALGFVYLAAGDAMAITVCAGPFATVISNVFLGQDIRQSERVAIFLSLLGVLFIVRPAFIFRIFMDVNEEKPEMFSPLGYVYIILGMLLAGLVVALNPIIKRQSGTFTAMGIKNFSLAVVGFIGSLICGWSDNIPTKKEWTFIFCVAVAQLVFTLSWTVASDMIPISHQSIILSFDKVWAYGCGVVIFNEPVHVLSVIGAAEVWAALMIMGFYGQNNTLSKTEVGQEDSILKAQSASRMIILNVI